MTLESDDEVEVEEDEKLTIWKFETSLIIIGSR